MRDMLIQQYGIFLIGAGLALVVLLLLFLLMRRQAKKRLKMRPAVEQMLAEDPLLTENGADSPLAQASEANAPLPVPQRAVEEESNNGGFRLFKRAKKASSATAALDEAPTGTDLKRLVDIEQEMLALRELFRDGKITRTVYVAETKALYETARLVKEQ